MQPIERRPGPTVEDQRGIALVTVLMLMVVLLTLGAATLNAMRTEIKVASNFQDAVQALNAAESGAEKVYDTFKLGDSNGDGVVDSLDTIDASNDLDGNGTIDFLQVFRDGIDLGSQNHPIEVNSGNTRAFVWVDATAAPTLIAIHSRGNPVGTNSQREVTLSVTTSGQNISFGALNNSA